MKIGFYSSMPLENKANWSGTMYKMYEQISALGYEIEWIPQIKLDEQETAKLTKIQKLFYTIFHRGYNTKVNFYSSKKLGKKISSFLKDKNYDILFVPTYLNDFAFVKTKIPIIYLNDANVAQLLNYYPYYSGFGWLSKWETKQVEKIMLNKSAINIFSSEWAANYAVQAYGINPKKVKVLKFGANLKAPAAENLIQEKNKEFIFLFLAVDWERKRGHIAYETIKLLHQKGYSVKLQIIGCNPNLNETWVNIIPYLNKNNDEDLAKIQAHLLQSHFLFVPTKADCTPIAFCEAAAYGLPIITTETGGVSAHVENGKTGLLLSQNSSAKEYAAAIEKIINNEELLHSFSQQARIKYEKELNWEIWRKKFKEITHKIIS